MPRGVGHLVRVRVGVRVRVRVGHLHDGELTLRKAWVGVADGLRVLRVVGRQLVLDAPG